jgi:hypothetical protein
MGIEGASRIGSAEARAATNVDPCRTPVSPADLRSAIGRAYQRVTGRAASSSLLDTLTAQASLETGHGAQMYNYNFGGIKGASPEGATANCLTHEVIASRDVTVRQGFRAYGSIDRGAEDYVRVLSKRFGGALAKAQVGDVDGFAHALKQAGYYTASEASYAAALHGQSGTGALAGAGGLRPVPTSEALGQGAPTSVELTRVLDALSTSALRITASDNKDDQ